MTKFNTGNPVGSSDPRDLYDNAQNLDELTNSQSKQSHPDRRGNSRQTWHGMEQAHQADQTRREDEFQADQADRAQRWNLLLANSGYEYLADYAAGIEITEYNQVIRDSAGELWRAAASTALPYTTDGTGLPESGAFIAIGDADIRNDLSNDLAIGKGALLVRGSVIYVDTIADLQALPTSELVDGQQVQVKEYHAGTGVGGGKFYWDAASTEDDNGGTVVGDAAQGRWKRRFARDMILISWWGLSEGASMVGAAQSALTAAEQGGEIIIDGEFESYLIDAVVHITKPIVIKSTGPRIDISIIGAFQADSDGVLIERMSFKSVREVNGSFASSLLLTNKSVAGNHKDWQFKNCTFDNVGLRFIRIGAISSGITVTEGSDIIEDIHVIKCLFKNYTQNWVLNFNGSTDAYVERCKIIDCGQDPNSDDSIKVQGGSVGIRIDKCRIHNSASDAIDVFDAKEVIITRCYITQCNSGVEIKGDTTREITFSYNRVSDCRVGGVLNRSDASIITGNRITGCVGAGIRSGGNINDGYRYGSIISGNICKSNDGHGIEIGRDHGATVTSNVCNDNAEYGVYVARAKDSQFSGNVARGNGISGIQGSEFNTRCVFDNITDDENGQFDGAQARMGTFCTFGGVGLEVIPEGQVPSNEWPAGSLVRTQGGATWFRRETTGTTQWYRLALYDDLP